MTFAELPDDPFRDASGAPRVVRGVAVYSGAPRLAELAARIGFETVWIELEHGPTDFARAEAMCQAAEAAGAFGTVRVPDGERGHVLRALEVGARVVVAPMIDTAEQARAVVRAGKFPPLGERGYNTRSRGLGYGLSPARELFAPANARTHLFVQIESARAVKNLEAICAVDGLAGIFIGPGDLSASLGCAGDMRDPGLVRTVTACARRARALGKHAGILVSPGPLLDAALAAGCDLVFGGGDVTNLVEPWRRLLADLGTPRRAATATEPVRDRARAKTRRPRRRSAR
jgi:4-hydroxy-2-oxoheptanedioate aldolase